MGINFDIKKQNLGSRDSSSHGKGWWQERQGRSRRQLRRRVSQKRVSGHPVVTFCAILAEFEAIFIIHPVFSGTTEMKGRGVCLSVFHSL